MATASTPRVAIVTPRPPRSASSAIGSRATQHQWWVHEIGLTRSAGHRDGDQRVELPSCVEAAAGHVPARRRPWRRQRHEPRAAWSAPSARGSCPTRPHHDWFATVVEAPAVPGAERLVEPERDRVARASRSTEGGGDGERDDGAHARHAAPVADEVEDEDERRQLHGGGEPDQAPRPHAGTASRSTTTIARSRKLTWPSSSVQRSGSSARHDAAAEEATRPRARRTRPAEGLAHDDGQREGEGGDVDHVPHRTRAASRHRRQRANTKSAKGGYVNGKCEVVNDDR